MILGESRIRNVILGLDPIVLQSTRPSQCQGLIERRLQLRRLHDAELDGPLALPIAFVSRCVPSARQRIALRFSECDVAIHGPSEVSKTPFDVFQRLLNLQ